MMETEHVEDGNAFPMRWEPAGFGVRATWEVAQPGRSRRFGNHKDYARGCVS